MKTYTEEFKKTIVELYENGNEIDLFNPDFLFEKNETVT